MTNLLAKIKQYFEKRKIQKDYETKKIGFGWAMAAHYLDREDLSELEEMIDISRDFDDWDSFDDGVQAALEVMRYLSGEDLPSDIEQIDSAQTFQKFLDYALLQEATARSEGNGKQAAQWAFVSRQYFRFTAEQTVSDEDLPQTEEQLIHRIVCLGKHTLAPKRSERVTPHTSVLVGIGNDHTAELIIDDEAIKELLARNGGLPV